MVCSGAYAQTVARGLRRVRACTGLQNTEHGTHWGCGLMSVKLFAIARPRSAWARNNGGVFSCKGVSP